MELMNRKMIREKVLWDARWDTENTYYVNEFVEYMRRKVENEEITFYATMDDAELGNNPITFEEVQRAAYSGITLYARYMGFTPVYRFTEYSG